MHAQSCIWHWWADIKLVWSDSDVLSLTLYLTFLTFGLWSFDEPQLINTMNGNPVFVFAIVLGYLQVICGCMIAILTCHIENGS